MERKTPLIIAVNSVINAYILTPYSRFCESSCGEFYFGMTSHGIGRHDAMNNGHRRKGAYNLLIAVYCNLYRHSRPVYSMR